MSSKLRTKTKVVVRKLPPTLTEEGLRQAVDKVADGLYTWFSFYPGKTSAKHIVYSRAYFNLASPDDVYVFKAKFDGHLFVSSKGSQYRCVVEYAPFQKVPKPRMKKDARDGTIEDDPDYQAFVAQLEQGPKLLPSAGAQREARDRDAVAARAATTTAATGGSSSTGSGMKPLQPPSRLMQSLQARHAAMPGLKLGMARRGKGGVVEEVGSAAGSALGTSGRGRGVLGGGGASAASSQAAAAAATAAVGSAAHQRAPSARTAAQKDVAAGSGQRAALTSRVEVSGSVLLPTGPVVLLQPPSGSRASSSKAGSSSVPSQSTAAAEKKDDRRRQQPQQQQQQPQDEPASSRKVQAQRQSSQPLPSSTDSAPPLVPESQQQNSKGRPAPGKVQQPQGKAAAAATVSEQPDNKRHQPQQAAKVSVEADAGTKPVSRTAPPSNITPGALLIRAGKTDVPAAAASPLQATMTSTIAQKSAMPAAAPKSMPATATGNVRTGQSNAIARTNSSEAALDRSKGSSSNARPLSITNAGSKAVTTSASTIGTDASCSGIATVGSDAGHADASSAAATTAAMAAAAASAAVAATTTLPGGRKMRAGFQAYVPGSLRGAKAAMTVTRSVADGPPTAEAAESQQMAAAAAAAALATVGRSRASSTASAKDLGKG